MRKVAVVTGASRGIGRAIGCRLIKEGYRLLGLLNRLLPAKIVLRLLAVMYG